MQIFSIKRYADHSVIKICSVLCAYNIFLDLVSSWTEAETSASIFICINLQNLMFCSHNFHFDRGNLKKMREANNKQCLNGRKFVDGTF